MLRKFLLVSCFSFTLLSGNLVAPAYVAYGADTASNVSSDMDEIVIRPMAEQTEWRYRTIEPNMLQRRLWSITWGKWLTDWEWVIGPN